MYVGLFGDYLQNVTLGVIYLCWFLGAESF